MGQSVVSKNKYFFFHNIFVSLLICTFVVQPFKAQDLSDSRGKTSVKKCTLAKGKTDRRVTSIRQPIDEGVTEISASDEEKS